MCTDERVCDRLVVPAGSRIRLSAEEKFNKIHGVIAMFGGERIVMPATVAELLDPMLGHYKHLCAHCLDCKNLTRIGSRCTGFLCASCRIVVAQRKARCPECGDAPFVDVLGRSAPLCLRCHQAKKTMGGTATFDRATASHSVLPHLAQLPTARTGSPPASSAV